VKRRDLCPEAIGFFIYHEPNDKLAVNGFKYVIRIGGRAFQVLVQEERMRTRSMLPMNREERII
jgi:hypothetical protein